jgi:hypothetical protein
MLRYPVEWHVQSVAMADIVKTDIPRAGFTAGYRTHAIL